MMDEQERTHCRLDLHKVADGQIGAAAFLAVWGERLDAVLLGADAMATEAELERATTDANEAEEALSKLHSVVSDCTKDLDRIDYGAGAAGVENAVGEITTRLESAL